jgi:hypothetical protein
MLGWAPRPEWSSELGKMIGVHQAGDTRTHERIQAGAARTVAVQTICDVCGDQLTASSWAARNDREVQVTRKQAIDLHFALLAEFDVKYLVAS